jgi:hypothetical protein
MKKLHLEEVKRQNKFINIESSTKLFKIILGSLGVILLLLFLEIWMVTRLSTAGDKISELKKNQVKVSLENETITNEIAAKSSLISLEKKAMSLGFVPLDKIEYINSSKVLASLK